MALSRRSGQRFQASIWPGFVDAMTGLLLVLMFVLTIFMVVQFVLQETITGQESQLDELSVEIAALGAALGLEQQKSSQLETQVEGLRATLTNTRVLAERQTVLIAALTEERNKTAEALSAAQTEITSFEAQVAALLSQRDEALGNVAALEGERQTLLSEQEALNLALAQARTEIDAQAETARLAAAEREALDLMIAELRSKAQLDAETNAALATQVSELQDKLTEEEIARLAEVAAAEALRERLKNSDAELTAMTLSLEAQRKEAEETLTLLAAAEAVRQELDRKLAAVLINEEALSKELTSALTELDNTKTGAEATVEQLAAALLVADENKSKTADLEVRLATAEALLAAAQSDVEGTQAGVAELENALAAAVAAKLAAEQSAATQLSEAEQQKRLLALANQALEDTRSEATESEKQASLLNQQVAALREQLGALQALLDDSKARDAAAQVQLSSLGSDLNAALARAASEGRRAAEEERKRRELEEAERKRLEIAAKDLEKYRSEFFGRMRDLLATREGVRIVGDRFVFSSEVLFPSGGADLSFQGREQIAGVAQLLREVADEIPPEINWVLQVDGHTDNVPIVNGAQFRDNWELSQARALSVVRFMASDLGLSPARLSANGFGEYQPIDPADTREARAKNRRIELKFTEK